MTKYKLFLKRVLIFILSCKVSVFLMTAIFPLIRFSKKKKLNRMDIDKIEEVLKPGMGLLIFDEAKFTHWLVKTCSGGVFGHAGICTEQLAPDLFAVTEMGHANGQAVTLKNFIGYSNHVAVIKPFNADDSYLKVMAEGAKIISIQSKYDNSFASKSAYQIVCSELLYNVDISKKYKASAKKDSMGFDCISPDDLYKSAEIVLEIKK